jgi:hypothetical protein
MYTVQTFTIVIIALHISLSNLFQREEERIYGFSSTHLSSTQVHESLQQIPISTHIYLMTDVSRTGNEPKLPAATQSIAAVSFRASLSPERAIALWEFPVLRIAKLLTKYISMMERPQWLTVYRRLLLSVRRQAN